MKNIDIYKEIEKSDLSKKYTNSPNLSDFKKKEAIDIISNFILFFKKRHL